METSAGDARVLTSQAENGTCAVCGNGGTNVDGGQTPTFVYALGRVEPRFPSLAVEKECIQAAGRTDTAGLTDRAALHALLSQRANRYLARQLCYVLTVEGIETYLLQPQDPADIELVVQAIRPAPRLTDVDVVIGMRGPIAPPEMCNGLTVPIVVFDQMYSFDVDSLIKSIPRAERLPRSSSRRGRRTVHEDHADGGQRRRDR